VSSHNELINYLNQFSFAHSEATSGICSIAKVILMFENKQIPPTIHFHESRADCPALNEGRLKVVDTLRDFDGKLISINSVRITLTVIF
jgi:3-oxoacyl-(acyl-carrier-protein) synthase